MPLYFAYGSNMDASAMARRCPRSKALGPARLMRHRLAVMREGWLTIARDPRSAVHGVLWDLALADVAALDRYEGSGAGPLCETDAAGRRRARAEAGDRLYRRQRRAGSRAPRLHRRDHRRRALVAACRPRRSRRWSGLPRSADRHAGAALRPRTGASRRAPVYLAFAAAVAGSVPVTPPRLSQMFGSSWAWRL